MHLFSSSFFLDVLMCWCVGVCVEYEYVLMGYCWSSVYSIGNMRI